MSQSFQLFQGKKLNQRPFTWGDIFAIFIVILLLYFGTQLAFFAPLTIQGPEISLSPSILPWYTALSVIRMSLAYILSILFTLFYGRAAAYHRRAEQLLMPLLDVLQSVPILSFLPVVLLSFNAIFPERIAAELASIVLIFTSQAWNLTFCWYQSLKIIPKELVEASSIFRLNSWMKFKSLELPSGMISLVWNSMMSWAGGWFFLMAAEIFTVGSRDFRLPGLGAYLHEAANQNNLGAIGWGLITLIFTVIILDQLVWRPLIAWSDRFKLEMVENDNPPKSWFLSVISRSLIIKLFSEKILQPLTEYIDHTIQLRFPVKEQLESNTKNRNIYFLLFGIILLGGLLYYLYHASVMLYMLPSKQWLQVSTGLVATLIRVSLALLLAFIWTIPLGVAIGTNPRLATILQPIVQVTASVPATSLFPVILLFVINIPNGLNLAAVLLMLMGTQWYLLFNIIAGASTIPQDIKYTTQLMQLSRWQRWRTLFLPAIFPYLITGAITASGGAWNASIVAEYQFFGGKELSVTGIGSLIAQATATGDYPLLLAATLAMILAVVFINKYLWQRLYKLAEEKYRME
jgi:NitT/TauT family transport system permease protein